MRSDSPGSFTWLTGSRIRAVIDITVAVLLAYLAAAAALDPPGRPFDGPAWIAWLVGAAVGLPLALRRHWPLPVFAWVAVTAAAATAFGAVGAGVIWVTYASVALGLYTVATAHGPVLATLSLAGTLAAAVATIPWFYDLYGPSSADAASSEVPLWWPVDLGMVTVTLAAAWVTGRLVRWRRGVRADAARRLARDAVSEERLRIARELHDIIGHSMSLIAVKATVANHIATERPEEVRAALGTIEQTSRAALTEIRRLLGVLRSDSESAAELSPAPGTADLPDLAERLRSAGLRVDLGVHGTDELPKAVDLTVYRIVQEALTNVIKHAQAAHCRVRVRTGDGEVHIEVVDDGRGAHRSAGGRSGGGQGLIGMRERVSMYGGTLSAGPLPRGGFQVIADIPYDASEESA
ncbi:sensor histidine kinase [Plantactinospora endophytica]|uniref:histidine kinase n=1 Tax=Plantactinospora endophytica TaxID=673535 RepID=A0ABQ4EBN6_9ACTN|nr:sensor histidine kinase [Plantactinospora endophytica]GIG92128.1 two-component sensor histidine kinase [Plantactinospora endophytica]